MGILHYIWIAVQILVGYNLVLPIIFYLFWVSIRPELGNGKTIQSTESDYAIIITAYEQTHAISSVVKSILDSQYSNFIVYIVADKCDISELDFVDPRINILKPVNVLASNTGSHKYAMDRFIRKHELVTIIDSDNLVHCNYLSELNVHFNNGYEAVQGLRKAKNINTTIAALDAARDIYYHFYDGKILFELGSSATLSGSGMAFRSDLYYEFLQQNVVTGAGFDKVLQAWLVDRNKRIAFTNLAVVYDEKTSRSDQLINQRARWINTWFKYSSYGFSLMFKGVKNFNMNQLLFGLILVRPPLFMFILLSGLLFLVSIFISINAAIVWVASFIVFILGFYISLFHEKADKQIYNSLGSIPRFVFLQLISLIKSRNANKRSIATKHYDIRLVEDISTKFHEDKSEN